MKHLGLFEGIGGFSLAARWINWETIAWCEKDSFCQNVLNYHFPNADQLGDIYNEDFTKYKGRCDIITGGFPCQPFSVAGRRAGTNDDRFLWGEMLRAIIEVSPNWVVAENVRGLLSIEQGTVFETVCSDLENAGYEVLPFIIPAAGVNAPHKRERLWIIAYRTDAGIKSVCEQTKQILTDRIITHTYINRPRNGQNKQKPIKEFERSTNNSFSSFDGFTSNTKGCKRDGISFKKESKRKESGTFRICNSRKTVANSNSSGFKKQHVSSKSANKRQSSGSDNEERINVTYTFGKRRRRESDRTRKARFPYQTSKKNNWENFPTQSPICSGDDGLSTRLDIETIHKVINRKVNKAFKPFNWWRRESIKAYGNAVVPNIPYEFFKIIELIEKNIRIQ